MKPTLFLILFIFAQFSISQVNYSDSYKTLPRLVRKIGGDQDFTYYVLNDYRNKRNGLSYTKVDMKTGVPSFVELPTLEFDGVTCRLWKSTLINGEIIELYTEFNGEIVYLLKRSTSDFSIKGEVKEVINYNDSFLKTKPSFYASENGIFVFGRVFKNEKINSAFLSIFDTDFNLVLSEDLSGFILKG